MTKLLYVDENVIAVLGEFATNRSLTVEQAMDTANVTMKDIADLFIIEESEVDYNAITFGEFEDLIRTALNDDDIYNMAVEYTCKEDIDEQIAIIAEMYKEGFESGNDKGVYVTIEEYLKKSLEFESFK